MDSHKTCYEHHAASHPTFVTFNFIPYIYKYGNHMNFWGDSNTSTWSRYFACLGMVFYKISRKDYLLHVHSITFQRKWHNFNLSHKKSVSQHLQGGIIRPTDSEALCTQT